MNIFIPFDPTELFVGDTPATTISTLLDFVGIEADIVSDTLIGDNLNDDVFMHS